MMQKEYYDLGKKLGLTQEEMDDAIKSTMVEKEKSSFALGPPGYGGGRYGSVSIKEFEE